MNYRNFLIYDMLNSLVFIIALCAWFIKNDGIFNIRIFEYIEYFFYIRRRCLFFKCDLTSLHFKNSWYVNTVSNWVLFFIPGSALRWHDISSVIFEIMDIPVQVLMKNLKWCFEKPILRSYFTLQVTVRPYPLFHCETITFDTFQCINLRKFSDKHIPWIFWW